MTLTEEIDTADRAGVRVTWRGWAALVVLMLPVLLVSVDNTVLAFALPDIARDLMPTSTQQLWVVDAYPLVLAALLVTMGTMGDRFGRRRMLLIGATGFAAVSVVAAFSVSAEMLIASRAAMGVFGAMLMPSTLSLLRSIFTDRNQRRLAVAIWASMFSGGAALGPIVGGILLEHFSWGSVFLMSVPVLVPLLILAPFLVPESKDPHPGRIDPISIALSMLTMVPIVYAIKETAVHGFGVLPVVLVAAGLVAGYLFVRRQMRLPQPMLDMRLFARGSFSGATVVNLLSMASFVGFLYFASQHLQLILGLSPLNAGLALVPGLAVMIITSLAVVPVAAKFSPRIVIPIVLAVTALGYALMALPAVHGGLGLLIGAFALVGAGIGAAETVCNDLILASAPPSKAGAASAVSETAYEVGAVLGTTVLGGVLTAIYRSTFVAPTGIDAATGEQARETLAGAVTAAENLDPNAADQLVNAAAAAFDAGVTVTSILGAVLVVSAAIVGALALRVPRTAATREKGVTPPAAR